MASVIALLRLAASFPLNLGPLGSAGGKGKPLALMLAEVPAAELGEP